MVYKKTITQQQDRNSSTIEEKNEKKTGSAMMKVILTFIAALLIVCLASAEILTIKTNNNEERKEFISKSKEHKNNVRGQEEEEQQVNLAQILTKASLGSLTILDAGDFVECYLLTRQAILKSPLVINPATPTTNSTTQQQQQQQYVTARKSALGFRYKARRPGDVHEKEKFELTLEYGPQRTGAKMDSEAMPMVSVGDGGEGFVSWENEGKVYFETVILSSQWENAVYLCPITGAVLSKILDLALDFVTGHPRYQPFEVFNFATNDVVLRSSSSDDFVWKMLDGMAKMYVDITPILIPPKRKLRLYVNGTENVQKMTAVEVRGEEDGVKQFYEKFYQCAKSLITGDDSYFEAFGTSGASTTEEEEGDNNNNDTRVIQESIPDTDNFESSILTDSPYGDDITLNDDDIKSPNDELPTEDVASQEETSQLGVAVTVQEATAQLDLQEEAATLLDTSSNDTASSSSSTPTQSPTDIFATVEAVTKEAAAKEAAAKEAAAAAAMQSLYSGDGSLITSTLSPCLYDPTYKINSTIFLFIDGTSYFQMKLVEPYWEAISLHESVPPPTKQPEGKGDFLDWFLVLFLSTMLLFGVLLALNKMGCAILGKKNNPYNREIEMADSADDDDHHDQFDSIPPSMVDYSPKQMRPTQDVLNSKIINGVDDSYSDDDDTTHTTTTPTHTPSNNRRNPDHVLFPGVRQTSSRVAVPHSSPENEII